MSNLKRIIRLCAFFCFLFGAQNLWGLSLSEKLAMSGYSEREIADILSGKISVSTLQAKLQREMLGYENSQPSPIKSVLHSLPGRQISRRKQWIHKAKPYLPIIKDAAQKLMLKESLLMAVIKVESDFDAGALSRKGAMGLMQIMPGTARDLGIKNPFDPTENVHGGARYLADCIQKFKDLKLGLAAYNAGPNLVSKLQRIPRIDETRNYVQNVMKYIKIYDGMDPPKQ